MSAPAREKPMSAHSKTQQVIDDITAKIRSGEWPPDHRLPPARELRQTYDCSQAVIRTALDRLRAAGWVVTEPGVAAFVAASPPI